MSDKAFDEVAALREQAKQQTRLKGSVIDRMDAPKLREALAEATDLAETRPRPGLHAAVSGDTQETRKVEVEILGAPDEDYNDVPGWEQGAHYKLVCEITTYPHENHKHKRADISLVYPDGTSSHVESIILGSANA